MIRTVSFFLSASIFVGCASAPKIEEMTQLTGNEVKQLRIGNTYEYKADWGKWTEVTGDDMTGVGKATGSFPTEIAPGVSTVSAEGEWCTVYKGDHIWSKPEFEYCGVMYQDSEGNYFSKETRNERRPERVGNIRSITVTKGDTFKLLTKRTIEK